MSDLEARGEPLRKAVRWISDKRTEKPEKPLLALVDQATLRFDLSPKDAEFLIDFFKRARARETSEE